MNEVETKTKAFRDYWDVVVRRLWLAVGLFVGVAALTYIATVCQRPEYRSTATMLVSSEGSAYGQVDLFSAARSGWPRRGPNLMNHIEILRSHTLAGMALDMLADDYREELARFSSADPRRLRRRVSVRGIRDADILQLSVEATSPELAQALANAYVEAYRDFNLTRNRADVAAVKDFVKGQLGLVEARLDSAEQMLASYKQTNRVTDLAEETRALVGRQSAVLALYEETRAEREGKERELAFVSGELDSAGLAAGLEPDDFSSPLVAGMQANLYGLEEKRAGLFVQGFPEASPRVQELDRKIAAVKGELGREIAEFISADMAMSGVGRVEELAARTVELRPELVRLRASEKVLGNVVEQYDRELKRLPVREQALARMTRDVEVDRQVYALLAQRYEETRIQEAGRISAVRVIDSPEPGGKVKPSRRKGATMALLLGLFLSLGTVFTVEHFDTRVRRVEDLERSGFGVLASVPRLKPNGAQASPGRSKDLVVLHDPQSPAAEAFRVLRTNLQFSFVDRGAAAGDKPLKTIVVTSPGASEGKTLNAANLALTFAQSGKRTLIIDVDLRRPKQHKLFGGRRKPGLTDVVMLGVPLETAVRPGPVEGLSLLPAGTSPPSPVDFLNSRAFTVMLDRLAGEYDCVILDAPPVLVSADAAVVAALADGVALIVRIGKTDSRALKETRQVLAQAGARVFGAVGNDQSTSRRYGYYRYKYRSYNYGNLQQQRADEAG